MIIIRDNYSVKRWFSIGGFHGGMPFPINVILIYYFFSDANIVYIHFLYIFPIHYPNTTFFTSELYKLKRMYLIFIKFLISIHISDNHKRHYFVKCWWFSLWHALRGSSDKCEFHLLLFL